MLASSTSRLKRFLTSDIAGGVVLMAAAVLAIALVNSPLGWMYGMILDTPLIIGLGGLALDKPLLLWINDGLMAIFFLYVALEIKEELVNGRLSTWKQASLPALAAAGGMLCPALIFLAINAGNAEALRGWAIPTATDIAFAVGAIALLGSRVPAALKIFLLALAILDDLGAIAIIALFYTTDLSFTALSLGGAGVALLAALNMAGVRRFLPYMVVGFIVWLCILKSGVHSTMAGVVLAAFIPMQARAADQPSPLHVLKGKLEPWVTLAIMPIFGFANAGVALGGLSPADLLAPLPFGIAMGLFLGKPIGIFGVSWMAVRLNICALPAGVTWRQIYGMAVLAGIGFTMSLFIGTLAFTDADTMASVRVGVLLGSVLSGVFGYLLLRTVSEMARERGLPERASATERMAHLAPRSSSHAVGAIHHLSPHRVTAPSRSSQPSHARSS